MTKNTKDPWRNNEPAPHRLSSQLHYSAEVMAKRIERQIRQRDPYLLRDANILIREQKVEIEALNAELAQAANLYGWQPDIPAIKRNTDIGE